MSELWIPAVEVESAHGIRRYHFAQGITALINK